MQVILKEKIAKLGGVGDLVNVKSGYARNCLLPQDKALRASKENKESFEAQRKALEKIEADRKKEAESKAEKLKNISLEVKAKCGDEGKLFGSIGTRDLAELVAKNGIDVEKQQLRMPHGVIRELGEYEFSIHLYSDMDVTLKVKVIAED
jgi:large subunit ribosomal protein L9